MSEQKTTQAPIRDGDELRRRMTAGETLHHGLAPGQDRPSWWLRPSMVQVLACAVYSSRREPATRPRNTP